MNQVDPFDNFCVNEHLSVTISSPSPSELCNEANLVLAAIESQARESAFRNNDSLPTKALTAKALSHGIMMMLKARLNVMKAEEDCCGNNNDTRSDFYRQEAVSLQKESESCLRVLIDLARIVIA